MLVLSILICALFLTVVFIAGVKAQKQFKEEQKNRKNRKNGKNGRFYLSNPAKYYY